MAQQFNGKLECLECHTIYLSIPVDVSSESLIHCSTCNAYIARWHEIEENFVDQGGLNGVFEMNEGHIVRMDNPDGTESTNHLLPADGR